MREIKFRAWDSNQKKMSYVVSIYSEKLTVDCWWSADHINPDTEDRICCFDEKHGGELMQFTGLKDKNGKEIYEGDIVKVRYTVYDGYDSLDGVVEYDTETTAFRVSDKKGTAMRMTHNILEVVGNFYENPELLTTPK